MTTEEMLLQTVASLTKINEEQGRQIAELTAELKKMSAQVAWFQRQMFGRKSEKHISIDNQPSLFDIAELDAAQGSCTASELDEGSQTKEETISYTRYGGNEGMA